MIKRVLTAVALVCFLVVVLTIVPVWLFNLLTVLLIAGTLYEFYRLTFANDIFAQGVGVSFGLVIALFLIYVGATYVLLPIIIVLFFFLVVIHMVYYTTVEGGIQRIGVILFGTLYLAMTLPVLAWLRAVPHGRTLITFSIAIVALGDTFAYIVGKTVGKRKMSPLISPNKTIEGFIASFFGGVAAALICRHLLWKELDLKLVVFLGLCVALLGVVGDLIESFVKRAYHVKDSGSILPGHGGMLDRIDALVFAAPFVYFLFRYLGLV